MLALENLNLSFDGENVINDVSFEVAEGELVCLLGPSGCGKTTILRLIAGLETAESGIVKINKKVVSSKDQFIPPHQRDIGLLFQDFALFPHLTVAQNISFGLFKLDDEAAEKRTNEMLKQIELLDHAYKYPHELSGGEQQRVALARARAPQPRLLLLDEPFSGLDTSLRGKLRKETTRILKKHRVTTVMVTHDPEEAMLMADRIVLMCDGKIVQIGSPEELYSNPVNSFAAEFFGEINQLDGTVEGNWIDTSAGKISNTNFPHGSKVEVLIRPDGLKMGSTGSDKLLEKEMKVCSVQHVGQSSHIQLGLGNGTKPHTHLQAKQKGHFASKVGENLNVTIDKNKTFIFQK